MLLSISQLRQISERRLKVKHLIREREPEKPFGIVQSSEHVQGEICVHALRRLIEFLVFICIIRESIALSSFDWDTLRSTMKHY